MLPIDAAVPEYRCVDGTYPAGVALPIRRARLRVGTIEESAAVGPGDKAVTFKVKLEAGPTRLQTWFDDADGKALCGAYEVYAHRLGSEEGRSTAKAPRTPR